MLCPLCKTLLRIRKSGTVVEGDNDPNTTTKVYTQQVLTCASKQCANYGKDVETVKNLLYSGDAAESAAKE